MNKQLRKIIKEEIYKVMMEIGEEDPMVLSKSMADQAQETLNTLEDELKYREADMRVNNMPKQEKEARQEIGKITKQKVEMARKNLEMAKKSEMNAFKFSQMQQSNVDNQMNSQTQVQGQSQIQSQI